MTACPLHYLGCDRSDAHLDFTLLGVDLAVPESVRLLARAANVEAWLGQWRRRFPKHQLCVCFEQPAANLIVMFSRFEFVRLYPVNPATLKSYRETFVVSRAKDDKTDGYWLGDLVRTHRDQLPSWAPLSPEVRKLTALVEGRRDLVDQGTLWSNKLTSLLKDYFPEALDLIGEHATSPLAVAFLHHWPTLQQLQAAGWPAIERFYREQHCGRATALARRRDVIQQARPLTDDPALLEPATLRLEAILGQIEPLMAAIARYDQQIAAVFAAHPDRVIIASLPGVGPVLGPRLLAAPACPTRARCNASVASPRFSSAPACPPPSVAAPPAHASSANPSTSTPAKASATALGPRLLPAAERPRQEAPHHHPRARLQVATHPPALLARSHSLRRRPLHALPQRPQPSPLPTRLNHQTPMRGNSRIKLTFSLARSPQISC